MVRTTELHGHTTLPGSVSQVPDSVSPVKGRLSMCTRGPLLTAQGSHCASLAALVPSPPGFVSNQLPGPPACPAAPGKGTASPTHPPPPPSSPPQSTTQLVPHSYPSPSTLPRSCRPTQPQPHAAGSTPAARGPQLSLCRGQTTLGLRAQLRLQTSQRLRDELLLLAFGALRTRSFLPAVLLAVPHQAEASAARSRPLAWESCRTTGRPGRPVPTSSSTRG